MNAPAFFPVADEPDRTIRNAGDPSRDIRFGGIVAILFFIVILGWAAIARVDAAAYTQGTLAVSGERQAVQHRDGGIVEAIYVHEGQRVVRGQLLVRLAAAEVRAQERSLASQAIRLLAQRARLDAEQLGSAHIVPPPEFANLTSADRTEAKLALRLQQTELDARRAVLAAQRGALLARVSQSDQQGNGFGEQATSAKEQLRLLDEQIAALEPVAAQGFVSKTRMRELERERAALIGQRGEYRASVAQASGAARESQLQIIEAERTFHERAASDLRDVENNLGETLPQWAAARDQLDRTEIRSPATGAIIGLSVFTPGGVIAPGQKLMDIVPADAPLLIQIRVSPDDADDLQSGMGALVKFPGLHDRSLPDLKGVLTRVSADNLLDEKTGQSYFTGEVTVPASQLRLLKIARGKNFSLRAGMPAQVLIPLRKRTVLEYILEPLVGSFWSSFREH